MEPYVIVESNDVIDHQEKVCALIAQGYEPIGGISVGMFASYVQTMYKKPAKTVTPRASKRTYNLSFDYAWSKYPKRAGSNPKQRAHSAYEKRVSEYDTEPNALAALHQGTIRYAKFCDATGKTGTEFVMQAATFFGPDKHYENDWIIPATKVTIPKDDNEAVLWGTERGIHPKVGEPMYLYRKRLEGAL